MTPLPDHLLERLAAAAVREGLADAVFTRIDTPIGRLVVVAGDAGIVRIERAEEDVAGALEEVAAVLGPRVVASDAELRGVRDALGEYFEGGADHLPELAVDLRLVRGVFRRAVLEQLRQVPHGATISYRQLAARAGRPSAARAAGTACATNPIPLVVPCHRVLPSTGRIGNYGLGGPVTKGWLLRREGVQL